MQQLKFRSFAIRYEAIISHLFYGTYLSGYYLKNISRKYVHIWTQTARIRASYGQMNPMARYHHVPIVW
jgi:hypothetical protein